MTELDVRRLRALLAVVRCGTFTAAGGELGVAQSVVSRRVAALERDLGLRLLDRTTHVVALTAAGERFVDVAAGAVEALDAAAELARRVSTGRDAVVLAVKPDSDGGLLPDVLDSWAGTPGRPPVELAFLAQPELAAAVRSGRADVAIIAGPFDGGGLDADELWCEQRLAVLPARHALAGSARLELADLDGEPIAHWPELPPALDAFYRGADRRLDAPPAGGPAVRDLAEVLRLVELGRAVTFLPRSVLDRFDRPGLVGVPVVGLSPSRTVVAWRAHSRSRAEAALVRLIADAAAVRTAGGQPASRASSSTAAAGSSTSTSAAPASSGTSDERTATP